MPLLWTNKNRVTRLFQIVSDFVQTRFPTSFINLFVKNRTHFKKPNSNNPFHRQISDPLSPKTPSFIGCTVVSTESDCSESPSLTQLINRAVNSGSGVSCVGGNNNGSGSKSVLVTFFMMIVIIVSIASFEKFTIGITVSAFVLLFLEYAVKRVALSSKANVEIKVVAAESCINDSSYFEEIKVRDTFCDDLTLDCVKGDKNSKGSRSVVKMKSKLKKLFSKKLHGEGKEKRVKRMPSCEYKKSDLDPLQFSLQYFLSNVILTIHLLIFSLFLSIILFFII